MLPKQVLKKIDALDNIFVHLSTDIMHIKSLERNLVLDFLFAFILPIFW